MATNLQPNQIASRKSATQFFKEQTTAINGLTVAIRSRAISDPEIIGGYRAVYQALTDRCQQQENSLRPEDQYPPLRPEIVEQLKTCSQAYKRQPSAGKSKEIAEKLITLYADACRTLHLHGLNQIRILYQ